MTVSRLVGVEHIAVAAPRIRDLLPLYHDILGGECVYGSDKPDIGWRVVHLEYASGSRVELMEPLRGSTFLDRFFQRTGGGGLHHITLTVDNIDEFVELLKQRGYTRTIANLDNPDWKEIFIHPSEANGVLIQLGQTNQRSGDLPRYSLEDVLNGNGARGTGVPSP
jgi:methylmalonyl-CoA/ethylmalonyl-CoA epimerase